ncbi:oxygen-independent coproporphyrinogen III oxidase [Candidatus Poribacteria bacterium]|nr:oxygen-independent coproporphyrinogen III oxidase [Candidatus Poribacteria bacterium]
MNTPPKLPTSLYIHIPFCATKCYYCAFNTYSFHKEQAKAYLDALSTEMQIYSPQTSPLKTIFIGGGTPSILSANSLDRLFTDLYSKFQICKDIEITVECNPGTVDAEKLGIMKEAGVNRLSFGLQAMQDEVLRQLGRIHSVEEFHHSYRLARESGFQNINTDLIFALPEQTMEMWQYTLTKTISLQPEHISAYNLVMEESTPFYERWKNGQFNLPSEDTEADMFQYTIDTLTAHGYKHYEICNYAKPNREVKHNIVYWNNQAYIGLGVGACGYVDSVRYTNIRGIPHYNKSLRELKKPIADTEVLTGKAEKAETLMLSLRKREGICTEDYTLRFGESIDVEFGDIIQKWKDLGVLEQTATHLRLTDRGLFIANEVFLELM